MITHVRRGLRWLAESFEVVEPEPTRLDCGDVDNAHRYVCDCGRTTCELHRNDPHQCQGAIHE